jgi:hypothetical protein
MHKAADTKSTASMTHVSSISEQFLKDAIAAETAKIHLDTKLREEKMDNRMQGLDDQISALTKSLVADIYERLKGADSPFVTSAQLDAKLDLFTSKIERLFTAMEQNPPSHAINSPPRKQARSTGPPTHSGEENPMSIDEEVPNCS